MADELDDIVSDCVDMIVDSGNDGVIIDQLAEDLSFQAKLHDAGLQFLEEMMTNIKMQGQLPITHRLPIARIKKIMKQDACTNPRQIGSCASPTMALACQLAAGLITRRTWVFASAHGRNTVQLGDIINALETCDKFDFLIDLISTVNTQSSGKKSLKSGCA
ncbi:MAG: hypothetical protein SGPRY_003239 [Prymnesium sp.]